MRRIMTAVFVATLVLTSNAMLVAQQAEKSAAESKAPLLNLNTATQEQLEGLPGIGKVTAQRILEYRQKSGGFKKIEELMNVKGIGEKSFLRLKPLITVPAKPEKPTGDR